MLLQFDFIVVLNLFVLLLWPVFITEPKTETTTRRDTINIIMVIATVIAVILDIVFLVLKGTGHA